MRLQAKKTAIILIDLQKGILPMPFEPRSGAAIVEAAKPVITRLRAAGGTAILVTVGWATDFLDAPRQPVDKPMGGPDGGFPTDWSVPADGLADLVDVSVRKRQWGAFYGTDLDLQLRRRGVDTILLCGVATNYGVESTARSAWEHGYNLVVAEDLTASFSADMHSFAIDNVLSHIGRVVSSADLKFD